MMSCVSSGIQHCIHVSVMIFYIRIICTIRSRVQSNVYHNKYVSSLICNVNVRFSFVINYVSKHQLPPVINISHVTPITCVNQGLKLLKLIGWRHYPYFKWVPYTLGTTAQMPDAKPGHTTRYHKTVNSNSMECQSSPGTLQWDPISAAQPVS